MSHEQPTLWDPGKPPRFSYQAWTVSELTNFIQAVLDSEPDLQDVWLTGEISNFTRATSGHLYFTLKDADAAISCVMWRSASARLDWVPKQGAAVRAHGRISVYPARGNYQLYVDQLQPVGLGDLHARFEQLRERLREEGLFDAERKRPIPMFPKTLGVVTSPQAAALRDVLNVLRRRYPLVHVLLAPTLVQGDQAPGEIVAALQGLDARDDVELILIVRGGGSLEELWAFNDERVARALAACRHPVISGVGHETDFTIADFVADLRAPTPSAAAELAVPDQADLRQRIGTWTDRLEGGMDRRLDLTREGLARLIHTLRRLVPQGRIDNYRQRIDDLDRRSNRAIGHRLALHRSDVLGLQSRLGALSPLATLDRGYAIVSQQESGAVVSSVTQIADGDALAIRVRDGKFAAVVDAGLKQGDTGTES